MTRASKKKAQPAEKQKIETEREAESEAGIQESIDERRRALTRKLAIFASDWRNCSRRLCRRARACRLPDVTCYGPSNPGKTVTPEQERRMLATLKRALERRMAEFRSREGATTAAPRAATSAASAARARRPGGST